MFINHLETGNILLCNWIFKSARFSTEKTFLQDFRENLEEISLQYLYWLVSFEQMAIYKFSKQFPVSKGLSSSIW